MIRKKYCGTAAEAGGNGENKPHPKIMGGPYLLENETPQKPADAMAVERTRMAADRTLMAWTRTSLSLIGFGFTIFKFLQSAQSDAAALQRPHAPQVAGLTLIGIGVFALVAACIQHWPYVKKLESDQPYRPWDLGLVVAIMIASLGLVMFVSILLRVGPLG